MISVYLQNFKWGSWLQNKYVTLTPNSGTHQNKLTGIRLQNRVCKWTCKKTWMNEKIILEHQIQKADEKLE